MCKENSLVLLGMNNSGGFSHTCVGQFVDQFVDQLVDQLADQCVDQLVDSLVCLIWRATVLARVRAA